MSREVVLTTPGEILAEECMGTEFLAKIRRHTVPA